MKTHLSRAFLFAAISSFCAAAAAGPMYKWVDENGETHYTQSPPPAGIQGQEMAPPPPPADAARQQEDLDRLEKNLDSTEETRQKDAKKQAEDAEYAAQKKLKCTQARERLMKAQRPRTNFVDADGSVRRASEEERQQQIKESEDQVKEFCS